MRSTLRSTGATLLTAALAACGGGGEGADLVIRGGTIIRFAARLTTPSVVVRLAIGPGLSLEVDAGRELPSQEVLDELARACELVLNREQQRDSSEGSDETDTTR